MGAGGGGGSVTKGVKKNVTSVDKGTDKGKGKGKADVKSCANCGVEEAPNQKLSVCTGCRKVWYCGRSCQSMHYKPPANHKGVCKPVRAAPAKKVGKKR